MSKELIDLLWRRSPHARAGVRRGPRAVRTLEDVVAGAIELADTGGADAVTIRALAQRLGMTTMSVYTHVDGRDDLLVLMADEVYAKAAAEELSNGYGDWRARVSSIAEAELDLLLRHPWLLDIDDPRLALGPGTIARYDRGLHALDDTGLTEVARDAALSFVQDFARAGARRIVQERRATEFGDGWERTAERLAQYLGEDYPLARAVGQAAGEALGAPYDARHAWAFGRDRMIAGLADLIER